MELILCFIVRVLGEEDVGERESLVSYKTSL